ncbi:AMP-binding protein, partial [Chitinophaga sp. Cy-1792]|uniref:AMP-binding protein n=1 Tax=Chitinophaga sp. Cy-1792 TaxID=2608339 RepID=UPI00141DA96C
FNDIPLNYTERTDVLTSFKKQVAQHPDHIAVVFEQSQLTYAALDRLSDQLAAQLHTQYQVGAGHLAGIMLDRSDKMIIAILGILKTGAAYVPVDPAYPAARKEFIIQDTGLKILITQTSYIFDISYYKGAIYAIDVQLDAADDVVVPLPAPAGSQLAYVIYTSGSTGTPKGCAVTRDNLASYIQWADHYYFAEIEKPSFGLFTSLSFDLTITSIFCTLTMGGCLHIYDQQADMSAVFTHYFSAESSSNCIKLTPSHISYLRHLELSADNICCAITGGEQVTTEQVSILKNIHTTMKVYNEYGPTETTVGCIVTELHPDKPVIIGKPISG